MVLSTTPPRPARRWATPTAVGLFAVAVALSGVTIVRADDKPTPAEKLHERRLDAWLDHAKVALLQDKPTLPAAPQPPEAPKPPKPPGDAKPAIDVEIRRGDKPDRPARSSEARVRPDVNKLRKQIDEALAAGKTDEAKKLIDALVESFAPPMPEGPTLPVSPQPPARDRRGVLAIESADPRITDALKAMRKAIDSTKDPEARAAMESAFKLLRDMPQERKLTQTVTGDDGRATIFQHGIAFSGPAIGGVAGPSGGIAFSAGGFAPAQLPTPNAFSGAPQGPGLVFGVAVLPVSEALAEQLQLTAGLGAVVVGVKPESPFAKAGVKKNDVVTSVGSVRLTGGEKQLLLELSKVKSGKVTVTVFSKGVEKTVEIEVPQVRERLDKPAARRVRFESKSVSIVNDSFTIEAKAGEVTYKITGKLADGKIASYDALINEGKGVRSLRQGDEDAVLSGEAEKYRPALAALLDSVRGN